MHIFFAENMENASFYSVLGPNETEPPYYFTMQYCCVQVFCRAVEGVSAPGLYKT